MSQFQTNDSILHHEMSELRVIKTEMELEVLRYVARISSAAHKYVMRNIKPGMREYQAESMFRHYSYNHGGCRYKKNFKLVKKNAFQMQIILT